MRLSLLENYINTVTYKNCANHSKLDRFVCIHQFTQQLYFFNLEPNELAYTCTYNL